ncbi:MAG: glycosyltransferase family 2 protein [Lysobacter sp.]|nr:glycosyltransferase family 2 protein [Lysobacter sp.]
MSTTFAVIITNYNYKAFVAEAIESALGQTRPPAQIIVVDDGSKDGSQDFLRERYGDNPRVTLLMCENGGQLVAFQRGLAAADADVVCFLDADDRWQADYLQKVGKIFDARPDVDFVFSDIVRFGGEDKRIGDASHEIDYGYTAIATYALAHWYGGPTSALSVRTTMAKECVDLPPALAKRWRLCADAALVYGASILGGRKIFLPTNAVMYRVHGNNGWWSNRGQVASYKNRIRTRELINHFGQIAGVCMASTESVKFEFRTKPNPTRQERRRYASIAMMSPGSLWKRIERAAGIKFKKINTKKAPD